MTEPLTPEAEARWRAYIDAAVREHPPVRGGMFDHSARLFATLDALRASLDPERPEAVEAWAKLLYDTGLQYNPYLGPESAAALLRARAEAERP
jgi:hypothetical protein